MGFFFNFKNVTNFEKDLCVYGKAFNGIRKWFFYIMKNDILLGFFFRRYFYQIEEIPWG